VTCDEPRYVKVVFQKNVRENKYLKPYTYLDFLHTPLKVGDRVACPVGYGGLPIEGLVVAVNVPSPTNTGTGLKAIECRFDEPDRQYQPVGKLTATEVGQRLSRIDRLEDEVGCLQRELTNIKKLTYDSSIVKAMMKDVVREELERRAVAGAKHVIARAGRR
jgi:hypothetical protein